MKVKNLLPLSEVLNPAIKYTTGANRMEHATCGKRTPKMRRSKTTTDHTDLEARRVVVKKLLSEGPIDLAPLFSMNRGIETKRCHAAHKQVRVRHATQA